jgi:hypothetical protein
VAFHGGNELPAKYNRTVVTKRKFNLCLIQVNCQTGREQPLTCNIVEFEQQIFWGRVGLQREPRKPISRSGNKLQSGNNAELKEGVADFGIRRRFRRLFPQDHLSVKQDST